MMIMILCANKVPQQNMIYNYNDYYTQPDIIILHYTGNTNSMKKARLQTTNKNIANCNIRLSDVHCCHGRKKI